MAFHNNAIKKIIWDFLGTSKPANRISKQYSNNDFIIVVSIVLNNSGVAETKALLEYYRLFRKDLYLRYLDLLLHINDNAKAGL